MTVDVGHRPDARQWSMPKYIGAVHTRFEAAKGAMDE